MQHTYSPTRAAEKARMKRTLDHIRIHPAKDGGFLVEHHMRGGDGYPAGEPEKYVHENLEGVHDHLDDHFSQIEAKHEPQMATENTEPVRD